MVNKIKIEKFTRNNSFNLWHIKIQALLKEEGIGAPLSDQPLKIDKLVLELQEEKVHFLILLSLSNEVLYEASKELTIVGL